MLVRLFDLTWPDNHELKLVKQRPWVHSLCFNKNGCPLSGSGGVKQSMLSFLIIFERKKKEHSLRYISDKQTNELGNDKPRHIFLSKT